MKPNIGKALITGVKAVGAAIITFVVAEGAFASANIAINDVTDTTKFIMDKTAPKAQAKRTVFGKSEEVNLRKGVYTSDNTPVNPKKLQKLREANNYKTK